MRFAIRDDDTCFFTNPEELEKAYAFITTGCISLSIIPNAFPIHKDTVFPYGENIAPGYYKLSDNHELVDYLKIERARGRYDFLLHGSTHEYRKVNGKWRPEMIWKDASSIGSDIHTGKELLSKTLEYTPTVFVAPSNMINRKGIDAIEKEHMHFSGIIQLGDRKITFNYLKNFCFRWGYRVKYRIGYGGVLDYGKHKEKYAYALDNYERLVYEYQKCKELDEVFVIYTHYWAINSDDKQRKLLHDIYEYAIKDGAELIALSDCFKDSLH